MHPRVIFNNRLTNLARARLSLPLALDGGGVFTTLAIYRRSPFLWERHWDRLLEHAARVNLPLGDLSRQKVYGALLRLIEVNDVEDGRARITLLPSAVARGPWAPSDSAERSDQAPADFLILTGDARPPAPEGLALTVSPHRSNTRSPLAGVKSVNYLERTLLREEARARHFDEAVVLNERGEIVSAVLANIFWAGEGTLHTPTLSTGCLAGTTRACVLDLAAELSIPVVEGVYDLAKLGEADEIFLTSAGYGVALVSAFDFHRYAVGAGSVAARIAEAFRQLRM